MSSTLRQSFTVTNTQGLHMRPLADFVKTATRFQSEIVVLREPPDERINGKSMLSLMTLGAEFGTKLTLEIIGPDADGAMTALLEILARNYDEEAEAG